MLSALRGGLRRGMRDRRPAQLLQLPLSTVDERQFCLHERSRTMKHSKTIRCVSALMFALCLLLCSMMTAFAGDGSGGGNGDGTGGGKDQPLVLASSSIANGSEDVSQNPRIVLTFSKNVVHFTVRDNNKKCFSMTDEATIRSIRRSSGL